MLVRCLHIEDGDCGIIAGVVADVFRPRASLAGLDIHVRKGAVLRHVIADGLVVIYSGREERQWSLLERVNISQMSLLHPL
jgi:hypothetical protein